MSAERGPSPDDPQDLYENMRDLIRAELRRNAHHDRITVQNVEHSESKGVRGWVIAVAVIVTGNTILDYFSGSKDTAREMAALKQEVTDLKQEVTEIKKLVEPRYRGVSP